MFGKTIKLFLADGDPKGIIVAELQQWTGIAIACPRTMISKLTERSEAEKPGVYILTGLDSDSQEEIAYIGEAENIANRLKEQNRKMEFWDQICFFTQKDDNLTKGHIRYLESRMIMVAESAKRLPLLNKDKPNPSKIPLPESDIADMEYFLSMMQMLLPVLGINLLQDQPSISDQEAIISTEESPLFVLDQRESKGKAKIIASEFTILKGSIARKDLVKSAGELIKKRRTELLDNGVLVHEDETHYRFAENHAFSSPSAASSVLIGGESNGRTAWVVDGTELTYGAWEESRILSTTEEN